MRSFAKSKIIVFGALLYFFAATFLGLLEDIIEDEHDGSLHLLYEGTITLITMVAIYIVWRELSLSHQHVSRLKHSLKETHKENAAFLKQIKTLKNDLLEVISQQFSHWSLTKSEEEVGFLLLKGLALDEISKVRNTSEKTTRQQASAIYKKAGLKGRHELAAYFFEDLF